MPRPLRAALRPLGGAARRARVHPTPLPGGGPRPLPGGAVELDTLHGTFWFDGEDEKLTPWIRSQATWEADVVRLLERTLRPGMVVVDVGANVGFHTVLAARLVAPGGRVHAVEPVPWNVEVLRANAWRHGCGDTVSVHPLAAGAESGEASLAIPADGRSGTELAAPGGAGELVRVEPLDALVPEVRVDLLKVDVEGAESDVIAGARGLIERSPGLLVVAEFRPRTTAAEVAPEAALARYETLGFELCVLRRDGRAQPADARTLLGLPDETVNIVLRRR